MIQTYLPLYRKYRPQDFAGLVGQDVIRQTLTNAIAMDRVAHAYLFCGPRGTGKTSTARIFAKSLNCEQGPTATPCLVCASCVGIAQGQALDVIEFDAASHNGVQDARELIETCQFAPMAGRYKVYIIDEVHMLSPQAFNTLLKTLEEPPERVVFIFATTEAHKVLPTIVSRCQRFDFTRIAMAALEGHLTHVAKLENIDLQPDATMLIARSAKGGLRDALSLLDQVSVMFQGQAVTAQVIRGLMGGIGPDTLYNVVRCITQQDVTGLLATLEQMEKDGIEPARLVAALTEQTRDLMLYSQAPDLIPVDVATSGQYSLQVAWFQPEHYPQWLHRLSQLDRQLKQTNQPQLWLEVALVELAHRSVIQTLSDLAQRLERLEAGQPALSASPPPLRQPLHENIKPVVAPAITPQITPAITPQAASGLPIAGNHPVSTPSSTGQSIANTPAAPVAPAVNPVLAGDDNSLVWQAITDRVPSPATRGLLRQQAFLKSLTDTAMVVGCSSEAILKTLQAPDKQIHLKQAVKTHFGSERTVQLIIEKPGNSQKPTMAPAAQPTPTVQQPVPVTVLPQPAPVVEQPVSPVIAIDPPVIAPVKPQTDLEPPPMEGPIELGMDNPLIPAVESHAPEVSDLPVMTVSTLPVIELDLQASKDYAVKLLQAQPLD